jgi:broad specificity phosphatase PhoE
MTLTNDLVLVRHATCERMDSILLGRTVDAALDTCGLREAAAMARSLASVSDPLIETSPRQRARQTAAAIAAHTGAEVATSPAIDEVDFGGWSGQTFAQLHEDPGWQTWNRQRASAATPAGERIEDVRTRTLEHLGRLQRAFPERPIILVTHAEIIRTVLLHWLGAPIDSYQRLVISPASLTRVRLGEHAVSIESINQRVAS